MPSAGQGEEVNTMAEVQCSSCGRTAEVSDQWRQCPKCGYVVCHSCRSQNEEEQKEIEKLRKGDAYDRLIVTCPSCSYGMVRF